MNGREIGKWLIVVLVCWIDLLHESKEELRKEQRMNEIEQEKGEEKEEEEVKHSALLTTEHRSIWIGAVS